MLENRLDKAMIKYNEAQSIRKTYEQIVKRLKVSDDRAMSMLYCTCAQTLIAALYITCDEESCRLLGPLGDASKKNRFTPPSECVVCIFLVG